MEIQPRSPFFGQRVRIEEGDIPVGEFLHFLSDYTGLPVIVDTGGQAGVLQNQMITIAAPIPDADGEIVKAILEANRWLVFQQKLSNGKEVLMVRSAQAAAAGEAPSEVRIIDVKGDRVSEIKSMLKSELDVPQDELATMVFTLRYTPPSEAISALNSLVGASAGAPAAARGAAARTRAFSAVEVKNTMMLIVTAKFGLLDYLQKLLSIIDVEVKEPERIVDIIQVEEADASELVSIIENFLDQRAGRGVTRARTTLTRTARPGTPTPAGTPTPTSLPTGGTEEYPTRLIPDIRTNKIIVVTYNESDLEDIHMLVRELDTKFDVRRLKTRIYRMRFLKAEDVAPVIQSLVGGGTTGLSGTRGLGTRSRTTRNRLPRVSQTRTTPTAPTPTPGAAGQGGVMPTFIVAHPETNSLIIQAEPEEYEEIINILNKIDVRRRQVFLEAALVQVSTSSALNYAIELLAGDPDDRATRVLVESSFGLSGIDLENFNRVIPDLTTAPPGALLAIMNRGKFPALVSFFKANTDSQVLATPFILADDNEPSTINITETRFVVNTSTVNVSTVTTQQGEDAGITLDILPRINSENSVLLEVNLEVSEFGQAATVEVLPPKTTNSINSAVTIPDEEIYVIGGLTRENKSKTVSKVPLLGDIPILGKLFRSEGTSNSQSNLYIFLRAHILMDPEFEDLYEISRQAREQVREFAPDLRESRFEKPEVEARPVEEQDPDAPRSFELHPDRSDEEYRGSLRRGRLEDYRNDPESPYRPRPARPQSTAPAPRPSEGEETGIPPLEPLGPETSPPPAETVTAPEQPRVLPRVPEPPPASPGVREPAPWRAQGIEIDPEGESWFVPLKRREHSYAPNRTRAQGRRVAG